MKLQAKQKIGRIFFLIAFYKSRVVRANDPQNFLMHEYLITTVVSIAFKFQIRTDQ